MATGTILVCVINQSPTKAFLNRFFWTPTAKRGRAGFQP